MSFTEIPIPLGFYQSESIPLAGQECVNFIPVIPQAEALSQRALIGAPGIREITITGTPITGVNRGSINVNGVYYTVNGGALYRINSNFVSSKIGDVDGTGRISMAKSTEYLVIVVPGIKAYTFNISSSAFAEITDLDFKTADTVVFIDGYFVFNSSDGKTIFHSLLNDPTSYDALDFGSSEVSPDKIISVNADHNELFVMNEETTEIFDNVGGAGFVFQRIDGAFIQKGSHARFGTVNFDNTLVFLGGGIGEKTSVWKVTGTSSVSKISTSAIDNAIQEFTREEIANAFAMTYAEDGNFFVIFTFESDRIPSRTFVFDATTSALSGVQVWHERQTGVERDRWRVNSITQAYGELIVADSQGPKFGILEKKTYTEYGNVLFRRAAFAPFSTKGLPLFWGTIKLTMESGAGLTTGQGSDPQIRYDFSDDGGRTFSSEFFRSYGKIGEYSTVPTWRKQGRIQKYRTLRFTTSEPVVSNILKLEARIQEGTQ
jgi:hypothetical protein